MITGGRRSGHDILDVTIAAGEHQIGLFSPVRLAFGISSRHFRVLVIIALFIVVLILLVGILPVTFPLIGIGIDGIIFLPGLVVGRTIAVVSECGPPVSFVHMCIVGARPALDLALVFTIFVPGLVLIDTVA